MPRLAAALLMTLSFGAFAAGEPEFALVLEGHKFSPERLEVPAGTKVKLTVDNRDATPEEFESEELRVEKVIPGKSKGLVYIGPLKAGEYKYIGEYNEQSAHGVIVAK
jgi:plastocyanin